MLEGDLGSQSGPGRADLKKVDENTRLIAVNMPNTMEVGEDWSGYRTLVKDIEQLTGYKFFTACRWILLTR